jgi:hypothetical protein
MSRAGGNEDIPLVRFLAGIKSDAPSRIARARVERAFPAITSIAYTNGAQARTVRYRADAE